MSSAIAIAESGLAVAALGVATAAHDVANAETTGFVPSRMVAEPLPQGGAVGRAVPAGDPLAEVRADRALLAGQGVDLVRQLVEQGRAARLFEASLASLQAATDLEGELIKVLR